MADVATEIAKITETSNLLGTLEVEVEIKASAEMFHHMCSGKLLHHVSQATPRKVQDCVLHEGDWGKVGAIVFWNYVHDGVAKVAKERIEAVEPEKNLITFRVLEGDLMKEYKSFVRTIQVTPKHGGPGSIVHWHLEYEKISDEVAHPESLLQFYVEISKKIDEHLLLEEEEVKKTETSSLVGKLEAETEIKASAEKFHHMLSGKPHHLPKATPGKAKDCVLHEGDWGKIGAIVVWNYVHDGVAKVAKERIEVVEPEKNLITVRVLDGDLMKMYKSLVRTIQVTPKHGGPGSIVHWHLEYENISDDVAHRPETILQFLVEISKEIDEHLLSEEEDVNKTSSLVGKLDTDVEIKASAEKFHHMWSGKPHHISKATPGKIQDCVLHEGDWGKVGSIGNYLHDGEAKVAKERIEAVDLEKNLITFRVLEGDLMKEYKSFVITIQVTPKHGGSGSIAHWHLEYEKISEEVAHPDTLLQFCVEVSKEIDEHLLADE